MKTRRPEWTPENAGEEFAGNIVSPSENPSASAQKKSVKRDFLSVEDYVRGIQNRDRTVLARAITLIESNAPHHMELAQDVLRQILPLTGNSIRVGVTGVPGVGKSTFIESLGCMLCEQGRKVAVLAIDPSSTLTKGSIMGDKTRMEKLSRHPNAFIRPSPTGGTLGGVARKSRETILLCEAFGMDTILVETVGVGQSETLVRSMVDFFLLLLLAGAGDELQGIKKGIMELADGLLITKADGDNKPHSEIARAEYSHALHYLNHSTLGWQTKAYTCSSRTGEGIDGIWKVILEFEKTTRENSVFQERRNQQQLDWVFDMVEQYLKADFYNRPDIRKEIPDISRNVREGTLTPTAAAKNLLEKFYKNLDVAESLRFFYDPGQMRLNLPEPPPSSE